MDLSLLLWSAWGQWRGAGLCGDGAGDELNDFKSDQSNEKDAKGGTFSGMQELHRKSIESS